MAKGPTRATAKAKGTTKKSRPADQERKAIATSTRAKAAPAKLAPAKSTSAKSKISASKTAKPKTSTAKAVKSKAAVPAKRKPAVKTPTVAARKTHSAAKAKPTKATRPKSTSKPPVTATAKRPATARPKIETKPTAPARAARSSAKPQATRKAPAPKVQNAKPRKAAAAPKRAPEDKKPKLPPYLAAELGQPVDHEGEPIGAGAPAARADTELQQYTLQLWRQMQSRRGVNLHIPAMERAGVTIDQIWTAGVTDVLTTSSTPDEVRRYKQKLLFRANLLESILSETVSELHRLGTIEPTPPPSAAPAPTVGEPG